MNATFFVARALARMVFNLSHRTIRLLRAERMDAAGPAILVFSHAPRLHEVVLLIAAFDRPLRCAVEAGELKGGLRGLVARAFRMIPVSSGEEGFRHLLDPALAALEAGQTLAFFTTASAPRAGDLRSINTARLALQAEATLAGPVEVYPADVFIPVDGTRSDEVAIHVGPPLVAREYLSRYSGDQSQAARALAHDLDPAALARSNAFALADPAVAAFLSDLQQTLREELADRWAQAEPWKQKPEDFRLSGAARDWTESMNASDPARLFAMSAAVRECRECYRRWTLARYESQNAGPWIASRARRILAWMETVVGFFPSCYGALNHFVLAVALRLAGLHRHKPTRDRTAEWIARAIACVIAYLGQILLCNFLFGRAVAGYYALSLPLSGAYLWRYVWLLRHRTRLLWQDVLSGSRLEHIRRARREVARRLLGELEISAG